MPSALIDVVYAQCARTRFPLPAVEQVDAIEERIGVALPPSYRDFLMSYNGGYFKYPRIRISADGFPPDSLDILFGAGSGDDGTDVASEADRAMFEDNFPAVILPVGYTSCGNLVLLVTEQEDCGAILIKPSFSDAIIEVAKDIEGFFRLLAPK